MDYINSDNSIISNIIYYKIDFIININIKVNIIIASYFIIIIIIIALETNN